MRKPVRHTPSGVRTHRACVAASSMLTASLRGSRDAPGERRLRNEAQADTWRRTEMGTNHIACFGIWRRGTRRQADRPNRANLTRWHMPHRPGAAFTLGRSEKNEAASES